MESYGQLLCTIIAIFILNTPNSASEEDVSGAGEFINSYKFDTTLILVHIHNCWPLSVLSINFWFTGDKEGHLICSRQFCLPKGYDRIQLPPTRNSEPLDVEIEFDIVQVWSATPFQYSCFLQKKSSIVPGGQINEPGKILLSFVTSSNSLDSNDFLSWHCAPQGP